MNEYSLDTSDMGNSEIDDLEGDKVSFLYTWRDSNLRPRGKEFFFP